MEELGYVLRLARERRGLTQTKVMELTGINNKTMSGYENGECPSRIFGPWPCC